MHIFHAHVLDRHRHAGEISTVPAICSNNRVSRIHIKERRGQFDAATVAEIDELSMIGDDCQIKPGRRSSTRCWARDASLKSARALKIL